ncbi:methyltransferase domain-containing protein [Geothrix sp. 21YS21S-2]|uniref:methyltransferase domain-containing protein n=1 Tax=Geothrix sp. 21YS21S-2 TaxID=3068893 RepID=UPI0027BA1DAD|nr:methyltransferase domain-containing protein [Geothrix sp. 21YS21S-2]
MKWTGYGEQALKALYAFGPYWNGEGADHPETPGLIAERALHDFNDRIPEWFERLTRRNGVPDRLLEIGCGHGGFLRYCLDRGTKRAVGVEVDEATCAFARREFGLAEVYPGLFPAVAIPEPRFDAVVAFDVLEHVPDPLGFLRGIAGLLEEKGRLLLQTPIFDGEGADWYPFESPAHLNLFSGKALVRLFEAAGLEVQELLWAPFPYDALILGRKVKASAGVRIAGEGAGDKDLTVVEGNSDFSTAMDRVFRNNRPAKVLETGTYLGTGTTRTLAILLRDYKIDSPRFFSLEVNPSNHLQAKENLGRDGLLAMVEPLLGLSVPRTRLPGLAEIEEAMVRNMAFKDVYVDHQENERSRLYAQETDFSEVPDDLLRQCLKAFGYRPDLVLLDSGGHMGFVEFQYLLELLEGPCTIALDDVFHVKHRRSLQCILEDPRFDLTYLSREKFGFCVAKFDPGRVPAKPHVENILWVRLDAVGDNLLAASMLEGVSGHFPDARITVLCQPRVAELYEACPFADEVYPVDKQLALGGGPYLQDLIRDLTHRHFDLCLHSVYSREPLADVLTGMCGALRRVGHFGDDHNRNPRERPALDALYTDLVPAQEDWALELDRHKSFLQYLGIEPKDLQPEVWFTPEDVQAVEAILGEEKLQDRKLVALFAGAQWESRIYEGYGLALAPVLKDHPELAVVALGVEAEQGINQRHLDLFPTAGVNLCGRLTLRQCAALMKRCALAVGAETGLAHMACAVGLPNVVVLGGGHFGRFMPYSPLTTCSVLPLSCYLCDWNCPYERPYCVKDLSPEVLTRAVRTAMEGRSEVPLLVAQDGWEQTWNGPNAIDLKPNLDLARVGLETVTVAAPQGPAPVLSLVVPSIGRPKRLEAMLASAHASLGTIPWEVIGICPSGDQSSREVFQKMGARIVLADEDYLGTDGKFSWSLLMNAGFAKARGKWVMYGSDDLLFEPDSLPRLLAYGELAGIKVGGLSLMEHNPGWQGYPDWWAPMGSDGWLMINFGIVRKTAWEAVGGFFPGYHFYGADWDLCYRIHAAGWQILPVWDARVHHNQEGDEVKKSHEERWQEDKDLMEARKHLRPAHQIAVSQGLTALAAAGARTFAANIFHDQVRSLLSMDAARLTSTLELWLELAPRAGFLWALKAEFLDGDGAAQAEREDSLERADALGWDFGHESGQKPSLARATVLCAVWHKDPDRLERLQGHQSCLDAQSVAVDRIYVFDAGDTVPNWLRGTALVSREPLRIYEAWNLALSQVKTPFVINLNLDDRLNPDAVELFLKTLEGGADLVAGDWRVCFSQAETDAVTPSILAKELPFNPVWPPSQGECVRLGSGTGERATLGPATGWRTALHGELGRYPFAFNDGSTINIIGDSLWWQRLLSKGKRVLRLPVIVGRYFSHPGDQAEFRTPASTEHEKALGIGVMW